MVTVLLFLYLFCNFYFVYSVKIIESDWPIANNCEQLPSVINTGSCFLFIQILYCIRLGSFKLINFLSKVVCILICKYLGYIIISSF